MNNNQITSFHFSKIYFLTIELNLYDVDSACSSNSINLSIHVIYSISNVFARSILNSQLSSHKHHSHSFGNT